MTPPAPLKLEDLLTAFETADRADWLKSVAHAIKAPDADAESLLEGLTRHTQDGVARGPLMMRDDRPAIDRVGRAYPLDRPTDDTLAWDVRAIIDHPDPATANAHALDALNAGASSLNLVVDPSGEAGVSVRGRDDLETVLADVALDLAAVAIDIAPSQAVHAPALAALLVETWRARRTPDVAARGALHLDPLGALARSGTALRDTDAERADVAHWALWTGAIFPRVTSLRADGRPVHEAGGGAALEVAWMTACALTYLKDAADYDAPINAAARQIAFTISVDADIHHTIAKLRAARRLWRRVGLACGLESDAAEARIEARASQRMLARRDPWSNMLRLTAAGAAAAIGGADVITLDRFTSARGETSALARRQALNIQFLLMEEAHAGQVRDPALGSYHADRMADDLAEAAWAVFQEIEAAGGAERYWRSGKLSQHVAEDARALASSVATCAAPVVGVTAHPLQDVRAPDADPTDVEAWAAAAHARRASRPTATETANRATPDLLLGLAEAGVDIEAMAPYRQAAPTQVAPPLQPIRLAAPFEALQDAADAARRTDAADTRVWIAALDSAGATRARCAWARTCVRAGGLEATQGEVVSQKTGDDQSVLSAWRAAGAPKLAILAGTQDPDALTSAVERLTTAGAAVWVAGTDDAALRAAGAQACLADGDDLVAALHHLHSAAGIGRV